MCKKEEDFNIAFGQNGGDMTSCKASGYSLSTQTSLPQNPAGRSVFMLPLLCDTDDGAIILCPRLLWQGTCEDG